MNGQNAPLNVWFDVLLKWVVWDAIFWRGNALIVGPNQINGAQHAYLVTCLVEHGWQVNIKGDDSGRKVIHK